MKRANGLWSQVTCFENLFSAYKKARKGKRQRPEVAAFACNLEHELFSLQSELKLGHYQPGEYRQFTIYDRKPRNISAAPFRDRVVHHALMNIVEPVLDKTFIYDSYACRKNKGVHAAVNRYQAWSGKYAYALKLDIASYFPSIDQDILKSQIAAKIKDPAVLWLFELTIDHGCTKQQNPVLDYFPNDDLLTPLMRRKGLPIGNLTSQILSNLYLSGMDHFIKESLKVKAYLRYVDDCVLLSNSKKELHCWRSEVEEYLLALRLRVHPRKANIFRTSLGVDMLGYRVFPSCKQLRNDNGFRFQRKISGFAKQYAENRLDWEDFNPSVQSWIGHAIQADTLGLRASIFDKVVFKRESGEM